MKKKLSLDIQTILYSDAISLISSRFDEMIKNGEIESVRQYCIAKNLNYGQIINIKNNKIKLNSYSDTISWLLQDLLNIEIDRKEITFIRIKTKT